MAATFKFYLREDRPNSKGECPIVLKITYNRKRKYSSTGLRIKPRHWHEDNQRVRRSHRQYVKLNDTLDIIEEEAKGAYRDLRVQQTVSADGIKRRIENSSTDNFFELAKEYQREIKPKSFYTWKQNRVAINKVKKFHGSEDLPLNYIDRSFLTKLIAFMEGPKYKNKASTIHKNFGAIRAILDRAVINKLIKHNPMDAKDFSLPPVKPPKPKVKLSLDEISAIENLELEKNTNLWHARNAFMLAYYFCGMRVGDLTMLKWKNVTDNRLTYSMNKTNAPINVKIPEKAQKLLDLYRDDDASKNAYILPFLSDISVNASSEDEQVKKRIQSANALINGQKSDGKTTGLKLIAEKAKIDKNISMHVARHSFAQYAVEVKNIPIYRLMVLLGHKSINTTMQYLKRINVKVADEAIDAIF